MALKMDRTFKGFTIPDAYHKVSVQGYASDLNIIVKVFATEASSINENNAIMVFGYKMNEDTLPVDTTVGADDTHAQAYQYLKVLDEYDTAVDA